MTTGFFGREAPIPFEGPDSTSDLAFRWYDRNRKVGGKRLEDLLRPAACYWHSFAWPGLDPFGGETFLRPWQQPGDPMVQARLKADVAFEMFGLLGIPFFTFHDRDVVPEGGNFAESERNLRTMAELFQHKMESSEARLLWGTANLFSHRRYMAGSATNPDPDVFAYAAATVALCMNVTRDLGGANYVLWGGREGYETLLNTDMKREMAQAGRFLTLVVEHKHKTGFKGTILIEPKPKEPTKHQYDFDVATVFGFLKAHGLENEVKVNIEQNHAILAGHSFEHEIALGVALGIFGSLDINRGDSLTGWDTDQFAMNVPELALAMHELLRGGGFTTGGMNFDAKIRRQSIAPDDLLHAHVHSLDALARATIAAQRMLEDGAIERHREQRYLGWHSTEAKAMLEGRRSLADIAARVEREGLEPQPCSGRQEMLEGIVNRYV